MVVSCDTFLPHLCRPAKISAVDPICSIPNYAVYILIIVHRMTSSVIITTMTVMTVTVICASLFIVKNITCGIIDLDPTRGDGHNVILINLYFLIFFKREQKNRGCVFEGVHMCLSATALNSPSMILKLFLLRFLLLGYRVGTLLFVVVNDRMYEQLGKKLSAKQASLSLLHAL